MTWGAMPPGVVDRRVRTNGIALRAVDVGRGRPLVFLHGLGWDGTLWASAARRFADRYRVIAGDTRGHGQSDKPPGPYSIDLFAADWLGLLDELGIDRAGIIGFSQGGMIAQVLALEHPERVAALVLVSTACRSDPGAKEKMEERIRLARTEGPAAAARVAATAIFSKRFTDARPNVIQGFIAWRTAAQQDPLLEATRAAYGFDVSARLSAVQIPTLVMYGDEDALTPPPIVRYVADCLPRPELVCVAGAGHMIPIEQPEAFESHLGAFLEKHYASNP
jgi:3-oxoadipate enol-lactonase